MQIQRSPAVARQRWALGRSLVGARKCPKLHARACRPCESCNPRTGETPLPLPSETPDYPDPTPSREGSALQLQMNGRFLRCLFRCFQLGRTWLIGEQSLESQMTQCVDQFFKIDLF